MKYFFAMVFTVAGLHAGYCQNTEEDETDSEVTEEVNYTSNREIGLDGNFSASTFGGSGGLGLKLGFVNNDKFVFGPSIRYQHSWSNINGVKNGFSVYGGGGFLHVRLADYFFVGTEIEFLSSPIQNGYITGVRSWVPVALVGGGFSYAFSENFRLNAGIMGDLINHVNSPLRMGYFMKNSNGKLLPIIYRIAFFIPI